MTKKKLSFLEAIAAMVSMVIGAGFLGIPYVVAQVGWAVGVIYLLLIGAFTIGINLLIGEVVVRTKQPLQIPGLAGKYLGSRGKSLATMTTLLGSYGALLVYLIGEGQILRALFGGNAFWWSLLFWALCGIGVFFGLRLIKRLDLLMTLIIFVGVMAVVFWSAPSIHLSNLSPETNWFNLFLPFGVILFSLQGAGAVPQIEAILPHNQKGLKKALIIAGIIPVIVYLVFMTAVVGVTGSGTTEIATIGLAGKLGPMAVILVNLLALFTMANSFLNHALMVKRQFEWDYKLSRTAAWFLAIITPLLLFIYGSHGFITTLDLLGAIFGSLNAIIIIMIYWAAKQKGDIPARGFQVHHALLLSVVLIIMYVVGSILTLSGVL